MTGILKSTGVLLLAAGLTVSSAAFAEESGWCALPA